TNGSVRVLWFTDDGAVTNISLGFTFAFYGANYTNVSFNANGLMTFGGPSMDYANTNLTTASLPDNLPTIAVLSDDWPSLSPASSGTAGSSCLPGPTEFITRPRGPQAAGSSLCNGTG